MMNDLALYIHIPFCVSKCRYCDFLSFPDRSMLIGRYLRELNAECADASDEYTDRRVTSIYIGGGTPSVLGDGSIAHLMDTVRSSYDVADDAEISIEVNPGSVTTAKLDEYVSSGINRLSIGLQSASDRELTVLGRVHTRRDFEETYTAARAAGFVNINIDLIAAIPGQTTDSYADTLTFVTEHAPEHISAYSLQLEEGTYFWEHRDEYDWVDEDADREMYHMTSDILSAAGYGRYEISNYSLPGYECRHNVVYWRGGDYRGFGIGAASYEDGVRAKNTDSIEEYLRGVRTTERIPLGERDRMAEFMFLGLRMIAGVSRHRFEELFGRRMDDIYGAQIAGCIRDGLMSDEGDIVRLTERGLDVSNYVFAQFL